MATIGWSEIVLYSPQDTPFVLWSEGVISVNENWRARWERERERDVGMEKEWEGRLSEKVADREIDEGDGRENTLNK